MIIIKKNDLLNMFNKDFILIDNKDIYNLDKITGLCEHNTIFDFHKYLHDILKTYSYKWENIYDQFSKDFIRTDFYKNNKVIKEKDKPIILKNIYNTKSVLKKIIIMLFNQSSLAWPMEKIIECYNIQNKYHLIDSNNNRTKINLIEKKDKLDILINKKLRVVEINENSDLIDKYKININLKFLFQDNNIPNLKKINKFNKNCLMEWTIEPFNNLIDQ